jgi:hypothetical protein
LRCGIPFEGVHRGEQPLERLAQLVRARVALRPADAHAGFRESAGILCRACELLQLAQPRDVLAQQLRTEQAFLAGKERFKMRDELHAGIVE